nr:hypothetical protein [Tanacetum cinerariifolium]
IDALYNILKQNQGDVNDAMASKKKTVVVTSDPLALIAEKTNVSKSKEKVVVSLDSEGSEADNFNELKKITALVKCYNCKKEGHFAKDCKKAKRLAHRLLMKRFLLALIAEKTNISKSKEKVVVSLDSEGSEADNFNELKKITALLAKAFNRR